MLVPFPISKPSRNPLTPPQPLILFLPPNQANLKLNSLNYMVGMANYAKNKSLQVLFPFH